MGPWRFYALSSQSIRGGLFVFLASKSRDVRLLIALWHLQLEWGTGPKGCMKLGRMGLPAKNLRPQAKRSTRFLSSPFMIRVPFFLLFGYNKGTQKQKGHKGTTQEPSHFWKPKLQLRPDQQTVILECPTTFRLHCSSSLWLIFRINPKRNCSGAYG